MQKVTRVVLSKCGVKKGETLHIVQKMWEYWMNTTLASNCKKEKVYKFGQQLQNMAPVLEPQNTDQFSKHTNKKIKSTRFKHTKGSYAKTKV